MQNMTEEKNNPRNIVAVSLIKGTFGEEKRDEKETVFVNNIDGYDSIFGNAIKCACNRRNCRC